MSITIVVQVGTLLTAVAAVVASLRNKKVINEIHILVNSKFTELADELRLSVKENKDLKLKQIDLKSQIHEQPADGESC